MTIATWANCGVDSSTGFSIESKPMREVSMRMLHLTYDLARVGNVDEAKLVDGLPSLLPLAGKEPDWIDWDDFIEVVERLERLVGGPEAFARVVRLAVPTAYPELRAFAAIFLRPIPLFTFVMTRLMRTMYRHMEVDEIERLGDDRVRWQQIIPEPFRGSEAFHRGSRSLMEVFPMHLDLPAAEVELVNLDARSATFIAKFPPSAPLTARGARALSAATTGLAGQVEAAFAVIGESLRAERKELSRGTAPPALVGWADKLALSPRQRDVFALLVQGRANKDIAGTLSCSERNIEFHVGRILRAARVTSRSELLVKVLGPG